MCLLRIAAGVLTIEGIPITYAGQYTVVMASRKARRYVLIT